jgi:Arc/MetJ family transcription regulator
VPDDCTRTTRDVIAALVHRVGVVLVDVVDGRCTYTHARLGNVYADLVRTNIVIDDELLAEAQRLCGAPTKRATVEFALQELVRRRERRKVLDLRGRIEWEGDLGKSRRSA